MIFGCSTLRLTTEVVGRGVQSSVLRCKKRRWHKGMHRFESEIAHYIEPRQTDTARVNETFTRADDLGLPFDDVTWEELG